MNVENAANRLEGLFLSKNLRYPQEVYNELKKLMNEYESFFEKITPEDFLSLIFHLWSKLTTGNFELAKSTLSSLMFFRLLKNSGDLHKEDCEDCGGSGEVNCDVCDGDGSVECDDCDGNGEIQCSECDGSGQIEDEDGTMIDCDECDGNGTVECETCDGGGTQRCDNCNYGNEECSVCYGEGEIESEEETDYSLLFGCSWDQNVINRAQKRVGEHKIFHKDSAFDPSKYLIFSQEDGDSVFIDDMKNDWYCLQLTKVPKLKISGSFNLLSGEHSQTFQMNFKRFLY